MNQTTDESWKTPQLRAAEAALQAAAEDGRETVLRARQFKAQIRPSRVSDEDIGLLDEAARAPGAPRALRELAERVDAGELNWRQIVDGKAFDDPGVRAAFESNLDKLARVYSKFEEGYSLEDVLEAETGGRPPLGDGGTIVRNPPAEDDDEDGGSVLRDSSW